MLLVGKCAVPRGITWALSSSNSDAAVFALQLGFTDDIDPALSLKLISQSMLAFLNRHLPLTEAQRSQLRQSQALPSSATTSRAYAPGGDHVAAPSQHMSSAEVQDRYNSRHQETAKPNAGAPVQQAGLQPGQVVLDGLSDNLSGGKNLTGRTYESRVKPEERKVFEEICQGNIAILELSL